MISKKRKTLNIEEKSQIISKLMNGATNRDLAKEYNMPHSTISTIWRDREKIKVMFERNMLKTKKAKPTKHLDVDKALLEWFKEQRANNVPVNGPILQQKANELARSLGDTDFKCSLSWIQRFRVRYSIDTCTMIGKAGTNSKKDGKEEENVKKEEWSREKEAIYKVSTDQEADRNNEQQSTPEGIFLILDAQEEISQKDVRQSGFEDVKMESEDSLLFAAESSDEGEYISLAEFSRNHRDIGSSEAVDEGKQDAENQGKNIENQCKEQLTEPSLSEGLNAIKVLRKILVCNNIRQHNFEENLDKMQKMIKIAYARRKQTKITQFFKYK